MGQRHVTVTVDVKEELPPGATEDDVLLSLSEALEDAARRWFETGGLYFAESIPDQRRASGPEG